jgi:hypothetical protein
MNRTGRCPRVRGLQLGRTYCLLDVRGVRRGAAG